MSILNKLTALGLSITLAFGSVPVVGAHAQETLPEKTFDCKAGESVTYYAMGNTENSVNDLLSEQWALKNDGSFSPNKGAYNFDYYDDPFGLPYTPGLQDDFFDNFFNNWDSWDNWSNWDSWDNWDSWSNWGSYFGFSSKDRSSYSSKKTAVSGIDINAEEAWNKYNSKTTNKDVIVAVIDTGVDYTHEDLKDSIWVNEDEIPNNGIDDDGNGFIDDVNGWNFYDNTNVVYTGRNDDHGTHCAGTIAASTNNGKGIASITGGKNVKVMILKALGGSSGTGETLSVVQAIKYAEANGASIVNLSLGSSSSDELLYNAIASSSMLFVVASGNGNSFTGRGSNTDKTPCYPASYDLDNIISVANLTYDGNLETSSNYGVKSVDIAAPGTDIISTTPKNSYGFMTGTSMSAPFVTAAAALIYSYYDGITLADVKTILLESSKKLDTLKDKILTEGMLDVGAALSYDTSKLSHKSFEEKKIEGKAPVLTYSLYLQNDKLYLDLTAKDEDNDIYKMLYLKGSHTAEDFAFGSNGTEFKLKKDSTANFVVSNFGTYTFYALDSAGNETVLVLTLNKENAEERKGNESEQPKEPEKNPNDRDWDWNSDYDWGSWDDWDSWYDWDSNDDWDWGDSDWDWFWDWGWNSGRNSGRSNNWA